MSARGCEERLGQKEKTHGHGQQCGDCAGGVEVEEGVRVIIENGKKYDKK